MGLGNLGTRSSTTSIIVRWDVTSKPDKLVRVDHHCQQQESGEEPGDKGNEAHHNRRLLVRKPADIHGSGWVRFVKSLSEMVRHFIEFPKLPFCERGVLPATDRGRVLVVFLRKERDEGKRRKQAETEMRTSK